MESLNSHSGNGIAHESALRCVAPSGLVIGGREGTSAQCAAAAAFLLLLGGLVLGFAAPSSSSDPEPFRTISAVIGWWYFMAWSISFLPQIYLNAVRRSVVGQSFDYVSLNVLGFGCYLIYTSSFYGSSVVNEAYRRQFHSAPTVDANDIGFSTFALLLSLFNVVQIISYDRGGQRVGRLVVAFIAVSVIVLGMWGALVALGAKHVNVLSWLYALSVTKIIVTTVKYLPQIHLNYQRKLTVGWNVWNVLLDFSGGILSVVQQLIDCASSGRWNGIAGNPAKFLLGTLSLVYDTVFLVQHFVLYRHNNNALCARALEATV